MDVLRKKCSSCRSTNVKAYKKYTTKSHVSRRLYQCQDCISVTHKYLCEISKGPSTSALHVLGHS